jgi:hypothetical protein
MASRGPQALVWVGLAVSRRASFPIHSQFQLIDGNSLCVDAAREPVDRGDWSGPRARDWQDAADMHRISLAADDGAAGDDVNEGQRH